MKADDIRELIHAEPFAPFVLVMASGERLLAHHREFIACPPGSRRVVLIDPDDRMRILDAGLIAQLDTRVEAAP